MSPAKPRRDGKMTRFSADVWFLVAAATILLSCGSKPDASSREMRRATDQQETIPGLEVFLRDPPDVVVGKRIGLITNHTGLDREGRRNVDLLAQHRDFSLTELFAFEHGLSGAAPPGEKIDSGHDAATGLPISSLYGSVRKPTPEMLENVDILVYDVQGVGSRTYTRLSTLALSMQSARDAGIPFFVLDRPNPLGGLSVEGGRLDTAFASFVGMYPIPLRHGMTVGELAWLYNEEFEMAPT